MANSVNRKGPFFVINRRSKLVKAGPLVNYGYARYRVLPKFSKDHRLVDSFEIEHVKQARAAA